MESCSLLSPRHLLVAQIFVLGLVLFNRHLPFCFSCLAGCEHLCQRARLLRRVADLGSLIDSHTEASQVSTLFSFDTERCTRNLSKQTLFRSRSMRAPPRCAPTTTRQLSTPPISANMDAIDAALADIESLEPGESINYTKIAKKYGVVRSTLTRRHNALTQSRKAVASTRRKPSL
ncbi:hypothetical protein BU23DRAFT_216583, partial [Bimuria novae-zelandiae CBS 107.79]